MSTPIKKLHGNESQRTVCVDVAEHEPVLVGQYRVKKWLKVLVALARAHLENGDMKEVRPAAKDLFEEETSATGDL